MGLSASMIFFVRVHCLLPSLKKLMLSSLVGGPQAVHSTLYPRPRSTPAWQGSHQTWKRHHLFELVLVYIFIRIRQMDERRASASVVGRVHSRATSVSVNPPGNGAIRRERENRPISHSFSTCTLLGRSTIPKDFVLWIWQVDLIVAPL